MRKLIFVVTLFAATFLPAKDQASNKQIIKACRSNSEIEIDGLLSEVCWNNSEPVKNFLQREPLEGNTPTENTEVYIVYDDNALYVGAMLHDSQPDSIIAQLGRRDSDLNADIFCFFIDPYYDHRSGYYFAVNAGGTLYDGVLYNDDWDDDSWDGVWEGKAHIHDQGWSVEMKIPYSQLRFHKTDKYKWAVNFRRDIIRKNEQIYLTYTPKDGSGFVSRFVDLIGIENIVPSRNLELLPYIRGKGEFTNPDDNDPFNSGSVFSNGFGTDIKMGIGNNLTLDATVNPDFGQVEVDPAVVNLSDVETFFSEKRPFFIEGSNIFDFGHGGSHSFWGFNWAGPAFFYSRRLGRSPQVSRSGDYDYASEPDGTTILSAAKLTGKLGNNWNIGTIHALTEREFGRYSNEDGQKKKHEIEPLSYYGVARGQKEINDGFRGIGFIGTFSKRYFNDNYLKDYINSDAFSGGIDGWTFLDEDRIWVLTGWLGMSHLRGNQQRIADLQQSSRHYFQRPDAQHISLDTTRTALTGFAGRLLLNKQKGNFFMNTAVGFIDPYFNVNDIGFNWRNDVVNTHFGMGYKWTKPTKYYRFANVIAAWFSSWDFGGTQTWTGLWQRAYIQFPNYYSFNYNIAYNPETISNRSTRGGPLMVNNGGYQLGLYAETENRKKIVIGLESFNYISNDGGKTHHYELNLEWKPTHNISMSFEPGYMYDFTDAFYVTQIEDILASHTFGKRYLFAKLLLREFSAGIRLNWTFTPELSFQLYTQPLISSGDYYDFKELARPGSYKFNKYNQLNLNDDNTYSADPDGNGPADPIYWNNPDFNIKSLRGNAVLRWEYLPGSALYLVWTQSRFGYTKNADINFRQSYKKLQRLDPDNIFMLKITYWLDI